MGQWPKNNKNRVNIFAGGAIWVDVREKLLMGRLTVLPNDEEMLLTDLSSKVRKKNLGPKNNFPKFGFWTVILFWVETRS